ncbi:hypothetical protein PHYBLDRAFT_141078 [Phycomyces blakesleeanus NRRL 1555(-)]|uniref:Uncharacterized protein n=1 Tax=Phycomyces blakesleeanus (strain ATCC 8743b / DSM 1359 / FGSC 10004 / NBRC 33097 / NRRL 1555) TaxID=763407 RepID=A0A162UZK9_PHYB8|nr:hypothetical protein PHYBLDRAFT_141078 [Phycomyces blakesleeanus NRRL 1555(-)]OAD79022.1 hypothetical protein PHYBLDRAFT_141078 [Phycomyces blakesleeanus NRRL 1555(-)]|eukprot:XP_018297062.1 hypothetical protein PHYBLDRAFT_141078 [Phycomyces blakesleeanus NRRL 1555(-)]
MTHHDKSPDKSNEHTDPLYIVRIGLVVMIRRFHRRDRGSIPRCGIVLPNTHNLLSFPIWVGLPLMNFGERHQENFDKKTLSQFEIEERVQDLLPKELVNYYKKNRRVPHIPDTGEMTLNTLV